jgi:hypothetical protein
VTLDLLGGSMPKDLALSGPARPGTVNWEPEGLRIALPADRTARDPVGVKTQFQVSGDFDIQASCDLLAAEEKSSFFGSGARLFVKLDSPLGEHVSLSRVRRATGGDVYLAYYVYKDSTGKQQEVRKQIFAASDSGRLRLRRVGDQLLFEAADDQKPFEGIHSLVCGTGDLVEIGFTASTHFHPAATEVRWKEATIVADALPGYASVEPGISRNTWYWIIGLASLGVVAVAIPVGFRLGRRRASTPVSS